MVGGLPRDDGGPRSVSNAVRALERDRDELVGHGQRCRMRRAE